MNIGSGPQQRNGKATKRRPGVKPSRSSGELSGFSGFGAGPPPSLRSHRSLRAPRGKKWMATNGKEPVTRAKEASEGRALTGKVAMQKTEVKVLAGSIHSVEEQEHQHQILKDAEKLVRLALDNPKENLSSESIHRAVDQLSARVSQSTGKDEEDSAQLLEEAQRLVRLLLGKPSETLSSNSIHRVMEQLTAKQTSKRYRFLLDKPWRTSSAYQAEESSHSQFQSDFFSDYEDKSPRRFRSGENRSSIKHEGGAPSTTSDLLVEQLAQTQQALEQARKRIHRLEERQLSGDVPSNQSLENILGSGGSDSMLSSRINEWERGISDVKRQHEAEIDSLKEISQASEQQLRKSELEWAAQLRDVKLDHKVKISALERKLADTDRAEKLSLKNEASMKQKIDFLEKSLAQIELDRRLQVSSLEKKLHRLTEERDVSVAKGLNCLPPTQSRESLAQNEEIRERLEIIAAHEEEMRQIKVDCNAQVSSLESQLSFFKKDENTCDSTSDQAAESKVKHLDAAASDLSTLLEESQRRISVLDQQVSTLTSEKELLTSQVHASENEIARLKTKKADEDCLGDVPPAVGCDVNNKYTSETSVSEEPSIGELRKRLTITENRLKSASESRKSMELENSSLRKELDEVKAEREDARRELGVLSEQEAELRETMLKLRTELEIAIADSLQVQRDVGGLTKTIEALTTDATTKDTQLQQSLQRGEECLLRLRESEQHNAELTESRELLRENMKTKDIMQQDIRSKTNDMIQDLTQELSSLRKDTDEKQAVLRETGQKAQRELEDAMKSMEDYRTILEGKESKCDELEKELLDVTKRLEEKDSVIKETTSAADNSILHLTKSAEALRAELMEKENDLKEAKAKANGAMNKAAVLENLLNDATDKLDMAESRLLSSTSAATRLKEVEDELESTKHKLMATRDSAADKNYSTDDLVRHVGSLERDLALATENNKNLKVKLESLSVLTGELGAAKKSLQDVSQELDDANAEKRGLERQVGGYQEQIAQLEQNLSLVKEENDHTKQSLIDLEAAQSLEQELLSTELRESESTIACLMEELEMLKPLAGDLEQTEQALNQAEQMFHQSEERVLKLSKEHEHELREMKAQLAISSEEIEQLRDQLIPLTRELQQANHELALMKDHPNGNEESDSVASSMLLQQDVISLRKELADCTEALERAECRATDLKTCTEQEVSELQAKVLSRSRECEELQAEIRELQPIVSLLEFREVENSSLKQEAGERESQLNSCRLQLQAMEEEQNYSRARIAELNNLLHSGADPNTSLEEKTNECADLRAERDTLRQKLTVVEAMATALEQDNIQKKAFVQQLMSKNGTAQDTVEAFIESLQNELERTLKRCADLSLQLADSQYRITELTESIRRMKKAPSHPPSTISNTSKHFGRSYSFDSPTQRNPRRSFSAMLSSGMAAMDESIRNKGGR